MKVGDKVRFTEKRRKERFHCPGDREVANQNRVFTVKEIIGGYDLVIAELRGCWRQSSFELAGPQKLDMTLLEDL